MTINNIYSKLCNTPSDINEHLPTLRKYASECKSVLELGVRGCVSSWAFSLGLLSGTSDVCTLYMNDITPCNISDLIETCKNTKLNIKYMWMNDLNIELSENVDLTFIDTWHVYGQLRRELDKFSKSTNKYIIMHDTQVDKIYGETIRCGMNAEKQSRESGIPLDEIICGLQKAIDEFLIQNTNWRIKEVFTNNNGLTILEKIN
jgi:hypothetical protein